MTLPCGTSFSCKNKSENSDPTFTLNVLFFNKLLMNVGKFPVNPISCNFSIIPLLQAMSYAFWISRKTDNTDDFLENAVFMSCSNLVVLSCVLLFFRKLDWYGHNKFSFSNSYINLLQSREMDHYLIEPLCMQLNHYFTGWYSLLFIMQPRCPTLQMFTFKILSNIANPQAHIVSRCEAVDQLFLKWLNKIKMFPCG